MKTIDARGKTCPQPVIMTKKEIDNGELNITVIVDNETAKTNLTKLGSKMNYDCNTEKKADGIYVVLTNKNNIEFAQTVESETNNLSQTAIVKKNKGYVFGTNILGGGSEQLGKTLMKGFIYTIGETKPYPNFMIFLNGGIKLTCEGSDSIDDLKKLELEGVKIVSCGTCLDFYELKEKLAVGEATNMYDIVETISNSDNAVMI